MSLADSFLGGYNSILQRNRDRAESSYQMGVLKNQRDQLGFQREDLMSRERMERDRAAIERERIAVEGRRNDLLEGDFRERQRLTDIEMERLASGYVGMNDRFEIDATQNTPFQWDREARRMTNGTFDNASFRPVSLMDAMGAINSRNMIAAQSAGPALNRDQWNEQLRREQLGRKAYGLLDRALLSSVQPPQRGPLLTEPGTKRVAMDSDNLPILANGYEYPVFESPQQMSLEYGIHPDQYDAFAAKLRQHNARFYTGRAQLAQESVGQPMQLGDQVFNPLDLLYIDPEAYERYRQGVVARQVFSPGQHPSMNMGNDAWVEFQRQFRINQAVIPGLGGNPSGVSIGASGDKIQAYLSPIQ